MAANFLVPLLIPLGEELANVTQLMGGEVVQFSKSTYHLHLSETTPLGDLVTIEAEALNTDGLLHYSLSDDSDREYFDVNPDTGGVFLIQPLDYERSKQHTVTVRASLPRTGTFSEAQLLVTVLDANDNVPQFALPLQEAQITEEDGRHLPRGILTVRATDADSEQWGTIRYHLSGEGADRHHHRSSNDHLPPHTWAVDRQGGNTRRYRDHLRWKRSPLRHSSSSSGLSRLRNPKRSIIRGDLLDPGGGRLDKRHTRRLYKGQAFSIDTITGVISVHKPLDRDPPFGRPSYHLTVTATDGQLESYATVIINLKDVNDNSPVFPRPIVRATVRENTSAGTAVRTITAEDVDEGDNAVLRYSLQENAVDAASGRPIFAVDEESGRITTALCCLDAERTGQYKLTLVASDGGGLKGFCQVEVEVEDENDVPPKWSRVEWLIEVEEQKPVEAELATLTVKDPDKYNDFHFRVLEDSGYGWQLISIQASNAGPSLAALKAKIPLDYENPNHKKGFSFSVQVTDESPGNWSSRVDTARVSVRLLDTNDNSPVFSTSKAITRVSEDTRVGAAILRMPARDADEGVNAQISYSIQPSSDPQEHFFVDSSGTVRVARPLDRETVARYTLILEAKDNGEPSKKSVATAQVVVNDVNDCAPHLLGSTHVSILKKDLANLVIKLAITDADDWAEGNGPPFKASFDSSSKTNEYFELSFKADGEGMLRLAKKWPAKEVQMTVTLVVRDAGTPPQSATIPITVTVSDAGVFTEHRSVLAYQVQSDAGKGSVIPLGAVTLRSTPSGTRYSWVTRPPHFALNFSSGELFLHSRGQELNTQVKVFVRTPNEGSSQSSVRVTLKNVARTEALKALPMDVASSAHKLFYSISNSHPPVRLLGTVVKNSKENLQLEVISAQEITDSSDQRITRLWILTNDRKKLQLLFKLKKQQIEKLVKAPVLGSGVTRASARGCGRECECCCTPRVLLSKGFYVIQTQSRSFVGPALELEPNCRCLNQPNSSAFNLSRIETLTDPLEGIKYFPPFLNLNTSSSHSAEHSREQPFAHAMINKNINGKLTECLHDTCLNGGRCIPSAPGYKCVCPEFSHGVRCKILSRHFYKGHSLGSWAWLPPLNPCSKLHFSLEVLTSRTHGRIITSSDSKSTGLTLELIDGKPRFEIILNGTSTSTSVNMTVSDNVWHTIEVSWRNKEVELTVDNCIEEGLSIQSGVTSHLPYSCRSSAKQTGPSITLNTNGAPLQLGYFPDLTDDAHYAFFGCIRNLRVNGALQDLGYNVLSQHSVPGCPLLKCERVRCPSNSRCVGSPGKEHCRCDLGWTGDDCSLQTVPISLPQNSFIQLALLFTPSPYATTVQIRFRSRTSTALLLALRSGSGDENFVLDLRGGRPCLSLSLQLEATTYTSVCLSATLNDGAWHALTASRYGASLSLTADEGDGELHRTKKPHRYSDPLDFSAITFDETTDKLRRSTTGNLSEATDNAMIYTSFREGCLDDLRIGDLSIPLVSDKIFSSVVKTESIRGVIQGCDGSEACQNITCPSPFTCVDTWKQYKCQCLDGYQITSDGSACQDIDECSFKPCLNMGICLNMRPGFKCSCPPTHSGPHCEVEVQSMPWLVPLLVTAAVVGALALALLIVCVILRRFTALKSDTHNFSNLLGSSRRPSQSKKNQKDTDFQRHVTQLKKDGDAEVVELCAKEILCENSPVCGVDLVPKSVSSRTILDKKSTQVTGLMGFSSLVKKELYDTDEESPARITTSPGQAAGRARIKEGQHYDSTVSVCSSSLSSTAGDGRGSKRRR